MKKINVAVFLKDGVKTGGWLEIKEETANAISDWVLTPGCEIRLDTTTEIYREGEAK